MLFELANLIVVSIIVQYHKEVNKTFLDKNKKELKEKNNKLCVRNILEKGNVIR